MTDNELIRQIRERAYDPARRFDEVPIPLAALAESTDPALAEIRHLYRKHLRGNTRVPAGSPEAVAFYRNSPNGPAIAPISARELAQRERDLGVHLPLLLRRIYTEVGDGGFGPAYGILGIGEHGHSDDRHHTAGDLYQAWTGRNDGLLRLGWPICYHGCAMYSFVSLTEPGKPVRLWDPSMAEGNRPETAVILITPTLADWLEDWLHGRNRLTESAE